MSEIREHEPKKEQEHWKSWTVSVMSASSNENKYAIENAHAIGQILAEKGYDAINGGYGVGGMGAFANGFREQCRAMSFSDSEIEKHLKGVVYSEKVIGQALAKKRTINTTATITSGDSLAERAGGIIKGSDAVIAVEGGLGTNIEALMSAQDEWFKERNEDKKLPTRPLILIESTNMIERTIELCEKLSPKTIDSLTSHIYVLSGYSNPDRQSGGLDMATLRNDPRMAKKLEMLLEMYYLRSLGEKINTEQREREQELEGLLLKDGSEFKVMTIKEKLLAKQTMHGEGEGI